MTAALASSDINRHPRPRDRRHGCCQAIVAVSTSSTASLSSVVTAGAVLDPRTALFGHSLDETSWDVTARNGFLARQPAWSAHVSTDAAPDGHVYSQKPVRSQPST
jgi:hypothetical protein